MTEKQSALELYKQIVNELAELYGVDDAILVENAALQVLAHQININTLNNW